MAHAIVTERLTKHYGPRRVVNGLSLRVPAGAVYGFLGRNGAGKSTTIKMLLGMAQPDFGQVELLGYELSALPSAVRGRIAYLAEGHPLYGWMTVAQASLESGFSQVTIRRHITKGALIVVRLGPTRRVRIKRADFLRYLNNPDSSIDVDGGRA